MVLYVRRSWRTTYEMIEELFRKWRGEHKGWKMRAMSRIHHKMWTIPVNHPGKSKPCSEL